MFSGIIEHTAKILEIDNGRFWIENTFWDCLKIGQSIAHDGACMTLEKIEKEKYCFFAMEESFKKTNFGSKKIGDFFNVERCIQIGERLDGHFVSGHIDTTGNVQEIQKVEDNSLIITIEFPKEYRKFLIEKGSIGINGVSLTVINLQENTLSISLIPLTQEITNLWKLQKNDKVNLEFDLVGKYIFNFNNYGSL